MNDWRCSLSTANFSPHESKPMGAAACWTLSNHDSSSSKTVWQGQQSGRALWYKDDNIVYPFCLHAFIHCQTKNCLWPRWFHPQMWGDITEIGLSDFIWCNRTFCCTKATWCSDYDWTVEIFMPSVVVLCLLECVTGDRLWNRSSNFVRKGSRKLAKPVMSWETNRFGCMYSAAGLESCQNKQHFFLLSFTKNNVEHYANDAPTSQGEISSSQN